MKISIRTGLEYYNPFKKVIYINKSWELNNKILQKLKEIERKWLNGEIKQ